MATVYFKLDPKNPPQMSEEQLRRMDELAERGGPEYYADIPELDDEFFATAERVNSQFAPKRKISLWVDDDVLAWLKGRGRGYQTRANRILRAAMESDQRNATPPADQA